MFNELKLTNEGVNLLTQLTLGKKLEFSKIEMGSGNPPPNVITMTQLVKLEQTLSITRLQLNEDDSVIIGGNLLGTDVTQGFFWREVGIRGKLVGEQNDVLIAYDNANTEASYIPAGGVVVEQLIDFLIKVTNTSTSNIVVDDSMMFITKEVYDVDMANMDATIPRKATTSEATDGTLDTKYMTPKTTKEAIIKQSITTPPGSDYELIASGEQPTPKEGKTIIWIDTNS